MILLNNQAIAGKLKNNIKKLMEIGKIKEAELLLGEYQKISENDLDICSINGILAMVKGDYITSEQSFKLALNDCEYNADIFFNLGCLYDLQERYMESKISYLLAKNYCKEESVLRDIEFELENINQKIGFDRCSKLEVVLYGAYESCSKFICDFKYEVNIIGCILTDKAKEGLYQLNQLELENLSSLNYDYIITLDKSEEEHKKTMYFFQTNLGINKAKLFSTLKLDIQFPIEGLDSKLIDFIKKDNIDAIITGLSYAETGIDTEFLEFDALNLALSSQDLYYDYNLLEYLFDSEKIKDKAKCLIINLAYYSFDFDISTTFERFRTHRYYSLTGDTHNYKDELMVKLLSKKYHSKWTPNDYRKMTEIKRNTVIDDNCIEKGKKYAEYHSKISNKKALSENIQIFERILELSRHHKVKPIVMVFPVSKYYYPYYDSNKIKRFYENINSFKDRYDFEILDYFDSELFELTDFWDDSHLNKNGIKKIAKIINEKIKGDDLI